MKTFITALKILKKNKLKLKIGDIILVRRYENESEKDKIKIGHRESPYIVISNKRKIYALQCTSNPHLEIKWRNLFYPLNKLIYNLDKNCYVNVSKVYEINPNNYIKLIGTLDNYDLEKINKNVNIVMNSTYKFHNLDLISNKIKIKYDIGDIIFYKNEKYYIYGFDKHKNYLTYKLNKKIKVKTRILINGTYYAFNFYKIHIIKRKKKIKLIQTFNTSEQELINELRERIINSSDNKRISNKGALLTYNNNYYYVKDEDDNYFDAYRVYLSSEKSDNMAIIKIDSGLYYTFFNLVKIKKDNYKIRRRASDEEIIYNEKILNLNSKKRVFANQKIYKTVKNNTIRDINDYIPKVIITNKNNNNSYLILSRNDDILELVNINDFKDYFYFSLKNGCYPYEYTRIIDDKEFIHYENKINEFKKIVNQFLEK